MQNKNAIDAALMQTVDGGNTPMLELDVMTVDEQNAWQKYLSLMAHAGYLSEEVLKEIAQKEEGFTLAMTRNLLTANTHAAKSEEVYAMLDERNNPLPAYMRAQIEAGMKDQSPKEYLEMLSAWNKGKATDAVKTMSHLVAHDEEQDPLEVDMLINALSLSADKTMDYKLVEIYDAIGLRNLGDALMSVIGNDPELSELDEERHERILDHRQTVYDWENAGMSLDKLGENELQYLNEYAYGDDMAAAKARSLLRLNEALVYEEPIVQPEELQKSLLRNAKKPRIDKDSPQLSTFPNPALDHITVEYHILEEYAEAVLNIMDANGRLIETIRITGSQDQKLIQLPSIADGSYQAVLLVDGRAYSSSEFLVSKR